MVQQETITYVELENLIFDFPFEIIPELHRIVKLA